MKVLFYLALVSAAAYPNAWYFLDSPYDAHTLYTNPFSAALLTGSIVFLAPLSFMIATGLLRSTRNDSNKLLKLVFASSLIVGFATSAVLYGVATLHGQGGSFLDWVMNYSMPGIASMAVACACVNAFVSPLIPAARRGSYGEF